MAFGQQAGPPASGRQVKELLGLLQEAGHTDFRDARGPMGFTQRQAGGKFTTTEATAYIDQLLEAQAESAAADPGAEPGTEHADAPPAKVVPLRRPRSAPTAAPRSPSTPRPATTTLRQVSAEVLAAELRRRGWTVTEP